MGKPVVPKNITVFSEIRLTPDGMVDRYCPDPLVPADANPNGNSPVVSKDVTLNQKYGTFCRVYMPRKALASPQKMPLVLYVHGGGFVFSRAHSVSYDGFCKGMVSHLNAMVVSVDYRRCPEHRLPAAYHDCVEAIRWIKSIKDEWILKNADTSQFYISGTSAGGNVAYFGALELLRNSEGFAPLELKGLILHDPYFSGTKRTPSEERLAGDPLLPLRAIDLMFDLSLPIGVDHDHEYCNPMMNGGSEHAELFKSAGIPVMVTGHNDDPLCDKDKELADMLEMKGVTTKKHFVEGYHGKELHDPQYAPTLYGAMKDFMLSK